MSTSKLLVRGVKYDDARKGCFHSKKMLFLENIYEISMNLILVFRLWSIWRSVTIRKPEELSVVCLVPHYSIDSASY